MRLNLIGNGFDMYHGLPCSYYYFACFLAEKYYDFFVEMSKMYGFKCGESRGYPFDDVDGVVIDDIFWSTFEEHLGELDSCWLEESLQDDLGLEVSDPPVQLEIPEEANSQIINKRFCEWVIKTVNTDENFRIIKNDIGLYKLKLSKNDYYINFNYTQTLEKIYGIDYSRINHIHGVCFTDEGNEDVNLIVGHILDEYSDKLMKKKERPSVLEKLHKFKEYVAAHAMKERYKEKEMTR